MGNRKQDRIFYEMNKSDIKIIEECVLRISESDGLPAQRFIENVLSPTNYLEFFDNHCSITL